MCGTDGNHECTCGTTATLEIGRAPHHAAAAALTTSYGVEGMTCSHCVTSVTEELSGLHGVERVNVELVAGGVSRGLAHSAACPLLLVPRRLDEGADVLFTGRTAVTAG